MQLGMLESRSLAGQVADNLEQLIIDNKLSPGDKIPNELDLVSQLGVGRGTIREAMKILESRSVVEIRRGKGTYVCSHVGMVEDPLGFRFAQDKKKLAEDLSDLRSMLEPRIAALSAERATDQDIRELQAICDEVEELILNHEDYGQRDMDFHRKIASISGNTVVPQIIPLITQGISLYVDLANHSFAGSAAETHKRVVDAIRRHDSHEAYEAMAAHMKENRENLKLFEINGV